MSSSPSPSMSRKAQPEPIIPGMKYVPVSPGSWVNAMPADSVTSSNHGGPDGASGSGPGGCGEGTEQPSITSIRRARGFRNDCVDVGGVARITVVREAATDPTNSYC